MAGNRRKLICQWHGAADDSAVIVLGDSKMYNSRTWRPCHTE